MKTSIYTHSSITGNRVLSIIFAVIFSHMVGASFIAEAQTMLPLPQYGSTYTSSQIRGFWFQAPTDFTIVGVKVPTDVGNGAQSVQIIRFAAGPPPVFAASTTAHTSLGLWTNINTTTVIPCNINIQSGDYIAVFGTRASGTNNANSYGTPSGPYSSSILGYQTTLTRMVYQSGSYPVQAVSQETSGSIARVEVYYTPTVTGPNDAGIASIDSPQDFCAGQEAVTVTLRNYGTNQLTSATINWTLNGATQTAANWTGLLDTTNITARQTQVTLATMNFQSGTPYTIEAWTTMPNGVTDTINMNDSASVTVQAAIAGTYTIGGASPDYTTIAAAVDDLNQFGLCGPVVFNIRSGTYNERVTFGDIAGASAVNTVTFQSEVRDRTAVTMTQSGTGTANNYVVQFDNASYITFRDMTLTATGTSYGTVADIRGGSTFCTLDNLVLNGVQANSTSTYLAVVYSPSGSLDHNTTITNSEVNNGSYGMYLYGSNTTTTMDNVLVQGCDFTGQYYRPLHAYYLGYFDFMDNSIVYTSAYTSKYIAYIYYGNNTNIERNSFFTGGTTTYSYGIYFAFQNRAVTGFSRFVNNFITSQGGTSTTYGVRSYYCDDLLFAHNTIALNSSYGTSYCVYSYQGSNQEFTNNMMIHTGAGRAWYVGTPAAITSSDYNNIYAAGPVLAYWSGNRATLQDLRNASGMDMNSVSKAVTFANESLGDLHLATPSDDDDDLIGILLNSVTDDIDNEPRVRPYIGADEACYITPNALTYSFVDGGGNPIGYAELPGTIGMNYIVTFPEFEATITMTVNFYSITNNQLQHSTSFSAYKPQGQTLDGTAYFTLPASLPSGFYRIEVVFNTKNSCGYYRDYMPYPSSLMLLEQGSTPCEVWPGDVNNDGVVNYTDRKGLNEYIHEANLRPLWLNGPARYRADAAQNPLTYLEWQPQASAPWHTAEGCYMDSDGNGFINNFDYIAIKMNWMKKHGAIAPKYNDAFAPATFDMSQNYPNPFNPTTTIEYSVPERSRVHLRIVDMLGREVDVAVDDMVETGVYHYTFDAGALPSGQYIATVTMVGEESGLSFSKTIKMLLNK